MQTFLWSFYISFSLSTRAIGSDAQSLVICAVTRRDVSSILFGGYFLSSGSDRGPEAYLGEGVLSKLALRLSDLDSFIHRNDETWIAIFSPRSRHRDLSTHVFDFSTNVYFVNTLLMLLFYINVDYFTLFI